MKYQLKRPLTGLTLSILSILSMVSIMALPVKAADAWIHYFPAADNTRQQGFARITNTSGEDTIVTVTGIDDAGVTSSGTVMFSLAAGESLHFNSQDLEEGALAKGLNGVLDNGTGAWRLNFSAASDLSVMGLFRNDTGFVNNIHDTALTTDGRLHKVPFFNPASNTDQASRLRLVNLAAELNTFRIFGLDDDGQPGDQPLFVDVPANASVELSASDLEQGAAGIDGALGDRAGKWRLQVTSSADARVMSLLEDPGGNLSNLTLTVPAEADGSYVLNYILPADASEQSFLRISNPNSTANTVMITGIDDAGNASSGDITIDLAAGASVNFRSEFFEDGNESIGLQGALGDGEGFWRLIITADQNIDVMGLFRTSAGFLNTLHDKTAPEPGTSHTVSFFNPGSNSNQVSVLRVNNLTGADNVFSVTGIDDSGSEVGGTVTIETTARQSTELTAAGLEAAGLGSGTGKWRLQVTSTGTSAVQSLLRAPGDFQSNLSTRVDVSDVLTGVLIDSPVAGLDYITSPGALSGSTTGGGVFSYKAGDMVTFSVGTLEFPPVQGAPIVTPLDMGGTDDVDICSAALLASILIQAFDEDLNPDNGIQIGSNVASAVSPVDFDQSCDDFLSSASIASMLASLGTSIGDPDIAINHFEEQLAEYRIPHDVSEFDPLTGAWTNAAVALFFLPDSQYYAIKFQDPASGFERGTWNKFGRLKFSVDVEQNENGPALFCSRPAGNTCPGIPIDYDVIGNNLLTIAGVLNYDRAFTSGTGLQGAWEVTGEDAGFAFLDDGTYLAIQYIEENGFVGFEKGTYQISGSTLEIEVVTNDDGDALLCGEAVGVGCDLISLEFSTTATELSFDLGGGDVFTLTRTL